jgi:AraC family transcriptional regulator
LPLVKAPRYQDIARTMRFVDEIVFESPVARVGRFRCAVSDSRFHYTGPTQNALVAFPRSAVIIRHAGSREFVADPTISTIYNVGQEYTRDAVSSDGDRSEWFAVRPRVAAEIVSRFDPRAADRQDRPYTHEFAAVDSQLYLTQRAFYSRLSRGTIDTLEAEETIIGIVAAFLRRAYEKPRTGAKPRPSEAHLDIVQRARTLLLNSLTQKVTLASLAKSLGVSEFHLCRVFHEVTGMTLHGFRTEVRLRRGLELLGDSGADITRVALDLGFSSHSHFTETVRRHFGATPAAIRKHLRVS